MCFKSLPIEFDDAGKARLKRGVADPYSVTVGAPRGYVRRQSGPGAQLAAAPRLRVWNIDPMTRVAGAHEGQFRLDGDTTALLFTRCLVESGAVARTVGMERLLLATAGAPGQLETMCEHVLEACVRRLRRDDDICLVGLRLAAAESATAAPVRGRRG